jgi:hypothetical protein
MTHALIIFGFALGLAGLFGQCMYVGQRGDWRFYAATGLAAVGAIVMIAAARVAQGMV